MAIQPHQEEYLTQLKSVFRDSSVTDEEIITTHLHSAKEILQSHFYKVHYMSVDYNRIKCLDECHKLHSISTGYFCIFPHAIEQQPFHCAGLIEWMMKHRVATNWRFHRVYLNRFFKSTLNLRKLWILYTEFSKIMKLCIEHKELYLNKDGPFAHDFSADDCTYETMMKSHNTSQAIRYLFLPWEEETLGPELERFNSLTPIREWWYNYLTTTYTNDELQKFAFYSELHAYEAKFYREYAKLTEKSNLLPDILKYCLLPFF